MNSIKKLIGAIFSFLTGLFKGFKKSEYFLELDDARGAQSTSTPQPVKPTPAKAEPVQKPVEMAPPAPAPTPAVPPAPVAVAASSSPAPQPEPGLTFAPNFLLTPSSSNGRRRPGPSLGRFMDMAKQVKTS